MNICIVLWLVIDRKKDEAELGVTESLFVVTSLFFVESGEYMRV